MTKQTYRFIGTPTLQPYSSLSWQLLKGEIPNTCRSLPADQAVSAAWDYAKAW